MAIATSQLATSSLEMPFGKILYGFSICLAILAIVVYFLKRYTPKLTKESLLNVVAKVNLGGKSSAVVLKAFDGYYLCLCTPENSSIIKIDHEQKIDNFNEIISKYHGTNNLSEVIG
jgi:flagellar biogenesis protein FliO